MAGNEQLNGREVYLRDEVYFMAVAVLSAQRSRDPNTQVGACIVNQENKIVGTGYNRMPNGCEGQLQWDRKQQKCPDNKHAYVCHAELNAIINSADVKGCSMYVSLFPCNECAKLIIQAGLKEVIYLSKYHERKATIASKKMLNMAGIRFMQFVPRGPVINIDINAIPPAAANQGEEEEEEEVAQY